MNDQLNFKVKGNEYTIKFPNVGNFRRIESLKQALSNGMYSSMVGTFTDAAQKAADMVDIESYLTVLCPEILKDLKCESFSDLGLVDFMELQTAYKEQFVPWWRKIMEEVGLMK